MQDCLKRLYRVIYQPVDKTQGKDQNVFLEQMYSQVVYAADEAGAIERFHLYMRGNVVQVECMETALTNLY